MDLQKVRESGMKAVLALSGMIDMVKRDNAGFPLEYEKRVAIEEYAQNTLDDFKLFLAELDKPVDDDIRNIYDDLGEIAGVSVANKMIARIQQYAESYAAKNSGWVSVKERLPEDEDVVFVSRRFGVEQAQYNKTDKCFDNAPGGDYIIELTDVTHWMPLPQPPRGE